MNPLLASGDVRSPERTIDLASPAEQLRWLRRFRPLLLYDLQEEHRALAVESLVANPGNALVRDGEAVAKAGSVGKAGLSFDLLESMTKSDEADDADHIAMVSTAAAVLRTRDTKRYPARAYGRVQPDGDHVWLQYWFWFYFRLGTQFGWRHHQGDWELFQIGLDRSEDGASPKVVVGRCGSRGLRADWGDLALSECGPAGAERCAHPMVKVRPFTHEIEPVRAENDAGMTLLTEPCLPDVQLIGEWNEWPGRWGATSQLRGFGRSPHSPRHQKGSGWETPSRLHRRARRRRLEVRSLLRLTGPPEPSIGAGHLGGSDVVVEVMAPSAGLRRARWLFVTVHEGDHRRVVRKRMARVHKGAGRLRIPLLADPAEEVFVRVSTFDVWRRRSGVKEAGPLQRTGGEAPALPMEDGSVMKRFQYCLLHHLNKRGALTVAELSGGDLRVLDLPLNGREVDCVVESARRHGLVEPLGHEQRVDGSSVDSVEWAPTDRGRGRIRGPAQFGFGAMKLLPVALLVPIVNALLQDPNRFPVLLLALGGAGAILLLISGMLLVHNRSQGALARSVASNWDRHTVELPSLNRWYRRPIRMAPYVGGFLLIGLVIVAFGTFLVDSNLLGDVVLAAAYLAYPVVLWILGDYARIRRLKKEAARTRAEDVRARPA